MHVVRLAEHSRSALCSSLSSKDLFLFRGEVVSYVTESISWEYFHPCISPTTESSNTKYLVSLFFSSKQKGINIIANR